MSPLEHHKKKYKKHVKCHHFRALKVMFKTPPKKRGGRLSQTLNTLQSYIPTMPSSQWMITKTSHANPSINVCCEFRVLYILQKN